MITQLAAMIRYEMRMQWRRRGLPVAMLGLLVGLLLMALWQRSLMQEVNVPLPAVAAGLLAVARRASSTYLVLMSGWPVAAVLLILSLPPIVSETIPKDSQLQVRELLRSLPLGSGVYLAGKLLSVWSSLLAGLAAGGLIAGLAYRALFGSYDLGAYLLLWLGLVVPLALFVSGLGTLLASTQPTRRRGTLVGVVLGGWCLFTYLLPLKTWSGTLLGPSRFTLILSLVQDYIERFVAEVLARCGGQSGIPCPEGVSQDPSLLPGIAVPPAATFIPLVIAGGALQVAVVWLAAWGWQRWKER